MPMTAARRSIAPAVLCLTATVAGFQTSAPPASWPPAVRRVAPEAAVLSPSEALKTFSLPPGYRLELVAAEPMVQDPILIEWTSTSRMWVVELPAYMRDISSPDEYQPVGRVVVLDDTDGDGAMDRRTIFADGLIQPRALRVLERGVLVGEPPNVWLLRDTDGDMRADAKELVATGYGQRETNVEVNANRLYWGLDNRIYTAGTGADLILQVRHDGIGAVKSLSRGQWGVTQDDAGRIYRNHNESVLHVDLVPTQYFARNPSLLRTRGSHERLIDPDGDVNAVWPVHTTPGTNRAYQHGILRGDGTLAAFTAACAPTVYRGDRLPAELAGNVFVAEPAANVVSRLVVTDDGTTLRARKAYERGEFVASTDERFRPVDLSSAPDGTLYIVDMYRGIIQHHAYITEYLRDQILARKLEQPVGMGRIYRVVHDTTTRDTATDLSKASIARVVAALAHPNGWWRDAAQHLLVQRRDAASVPALVRLVEDGGDRRTRLHALWTLDGMDAVEPAVASKALGDASPDVRTAALRIAERWLADADPALRAAVLARAADSHWGVRHQLAASLGALPPGHREPAVASLIARYGNDPITLDAALSGLRGLEAAVLEVLLQGGRVQTPQHDAAVAMLAGTLIRSGQESAAQGVFTMAADRSRPGWQRSALMHGAEIALLNAPMPGTPEPRRNTAAPTGALPCPTCPGGRAGPGGAYAFRKPEPASQGRGRAGGPQLRLTREPVSLSALAASGGDLGKRAASVLARVAWPGKAGSATAVPELTADELRRFEAGRQVYRNICQACHQPDGRGQERLAPPLVGSDLTLGTAEVPVRILLNGKEGAVGLMPPVGGVLTDDQIASVLTYVRREWGQAGAPVDPVMVKAVRAATSTRTRPWTDQELIEIGHGRRGPGRE
jgi:mono/diheme cytochrome c family protein/glucose/arabinose dehydrogenase